MTNLIPPIQKQKLFWERIEKMVFIVWFLVFFFILCLVLVLFSIKTYANSQFQSEKATALQSKGEFSSAKVEEFKKKIDLVNSQIIKIDSFYNEKIYFSEILEEISFILPDRIYLKEISLIVDSDKNIKTSLQGFSPDRESLFNFREILEEKNEFINISFPPSSWIEKYDINFSVSFEIKK